MDPFVDQLKGLCAAHPTRAKWVFVPTHAIGRTLGERIALRARLAEPAVRHAARHRAAHGRAVPRRARHRSVRRGARPGADDAAAARSAARRAATSGRSPISRRWRRRCGRRCASCGWRASSPSDLKPEAFESPAKHAELRALLAAYEQFLDDAQPRRHGRRLRRGAAASGLVSDPAAGLLDRAAGRHLDAAAAPADRRDAGRAHRAARASSFPASTIPRRLAVATRSSASRRCRDATRWRS